MAMTAGENFDPVERDRFDTYAARWWDPEGEFRPLHDLNPARFAWVAGRTALDGRRVLDAGCGGGLFSEALAAAGAAVTALDVAPKALAVARLHLAESGLAVDYRESTVEAFAATAPAPFAVLTCMEMLEHVPEPWSAVAACAALVAPGGDLFFSTINRTPRAFALAIVGAEHVLGLLPRGTHQYRRLIRPAELAAWCRTAGLVVRETAGLYYNPLTRRAWTGDGVEVNYLLHASKPAGR